MTQQWPDAPTPTAQETAAVNSKPELEPCPFCSGTPVYDHDDDGWIWIECGQCGVSTMTAVHAEEDCRPILAAAWNRRAAPPADTAIEPLSDEQIEPLFRQINGMRVVGEKDEWFWFAWGVEMGERAHGIRSSGARHSAGTDRLGSDEKESDAALLREAMEALETCDGDKDGYKGPAQWYDEEKVEATIVKLRERLKEAT
jgi:ribosomal protein S27AE